MMHWFSPRLSLALGSTAMVAALAAALDLRRRRRRQRRSLPDFDAVVDRSLLLTEKYDLKGTLFGATAQAIPMWVADADLPMCPRIHEAIVERARTPSFGYTIQPLWLWEAVARWLFVNHGWNVDPGSFVFSKCVINGVVGCLRAFTLPGDACLVFTPLYGPLQRLVEAEGRRLVRHGMQRSRRSVAQLAKDGGALPLETMMYSLDFDGLEAQIVREAVRLIIFCNPHNPGGRVWFPEELQCLAAICERNNVIVISDEVHADWCLFGHRHTPMATIMNKTLVATVSGPGKSFWIPGLDCSFVILQDEELRNGYNAATAHTLTNEGGVFATTVMYAAYTSGGPWLEAAKAYVERNVIDVELFVAARMQRVKVWRPMATILVWLDFGEVGLPDEEVHRLLVESGIVLSPGIHFGKEGKNFQRMNVACTRAVLQEALRRLEKAVAIMAEQAQLLGHPSPAGLLQ